MFHVADGACIYHRPGEVQDFVKKIKIEDAKIENRKKQLAKAAERIAAARAKAAVAASPAPAAIPQESVSSPVPTGPRAIATSSAPPATPPLHPSLPAKPGTAPSRPPPAPVPEATPPPVAAPVPIPVVTPVSVVEVAPPPDDLIIQYEENKQRWSWLALRTARDQYLQHFGKIGTGDVVLLAQEIEKEKTEKENALRGENPNPENRDEGGTSPMVGSTLTIASLASESKLEDLAVGESAPGAVDAAEAKPDTTESQSDVAAQNPGSTAEVHNTEGDVKMEV